MSSSKRTAVTPKEWAKHLRPFGKKEFWSSVRNVFRSEEKEEMIDNKKIYEEELRASLNGEPGFVDKSIKPTLENTFQEVELS